MKSVEVQQSDANDSAQQLEAPARGSVFDYLYHDARRVGSFLAQFETYGVPSQVKATEGSGRSETTRTTGGADLGVPGVIKAQTAVDAAFAALRFREWLSRQTDDVRALYRDVFTPPLT